jgi:hypothetical protein
MPYQRTSYSLGRLVALAVAAGVAFGAVYAYLLATFPLLTGSDLHARFQSAAVVALGFPSQLAFPTLAPLVERVGVAPFAARVCLAVLNGVLWATVLLAFRQAARRGTPGG